MSKLGFTEVCIIIMVANSFFSAFSQILLKKSTFIQYNSVIREYLNIRVIAAYGIFVLVLLSNAFAFRGIPYKYGSVIGATSYVFLMILSKLLLKEKIEKNVLVGNLIIVAGIFIYSL